MFPTPVRTPERDNCMKFDDTYGKIKTTEKYCLLRIHSTEKNKRGSRYKLLANRVTVFQCSMWKAEMRF